MKGVDAHAWLDGSKWSRGESVLCMPVVAKFYHLDEEGPDPDPNQSERPDPDPRQCERSDLLTNTKGTRLFVCPYRTLRY
jgi:hypothetical protein